MIVHTNPYKHHWTPGVWAPQLKLDFLVDGANIGHAMILAMPELAFVLYVQVEQEYRGKGYGLEIHRILAERYGAVACELHCSDSEMRVWVAMAKRRDEWRLSKRPGPTKLCHLGTTRIPAICRSGAGVHEMLVGRLVSPERN